MCRTTTLTAICLLLFTGTAEAATITVPPGGNLTTAYNQAASGDTIQLQTGLYGTWRPAGTKAITVKGSTTGRSVFRQLLSDADNITFDGVHVDGNNQVPAIQSALFETGGNANVTFKNGSIGNVVDQKGALLGGTNSAASLNIVIDNVRFYNVRPVGSTVHNECVYLMAPGTVIKNSTFEGTCGNTGAILTQRGSWWGQPAFNGLQFLNNTFARQLFDHGSILFGNHCGDIGAVCRDIVIRGNTFDSHSMPGDATPGLTYTNSFESCNTPRVDLPGITHETCGAPPPPPPPPPDGDGDGFPDSTDLCPTVAGQAPDGCPPVVPPPPPPYDPACRPSCDAQIATLTAALAAARGERDAAVQKLAQIHTLSAP